MQAVEQQGVKVYDLCVGKTLPQWLSAKSKKALRKDEEYRSRIELVQDFHFNTSSQRIRMAEDGVHIVATGVYKPQVKVYDTRELSLKFERTLNAEVVQFEVLSHDYTKLVFLGVDRTLNFHAAYGSHYTVRVPRFGRDLAYDPYGCELFVGGSSESIYRLDLEQGQFMAPYESSHGGINALDFCRPLQMLVAGGEDGVVSCWDVRTRSRVGALEVAENDEVSAVKMDASGLLMGVGTDEGKVSIFDVRSSRPLQTKIHRNEEKIVSISFQQAGRLVASADPYAIRLWNRDTGDTFVNIEPQAKVNEIHLVQSTGAAGRRTSGLILAAGETERIMSFYVPRLGPAPGWASFLDNLTEELEEKNSSTQEVYDSYKFLTLKELETLGVANLLGTPLLRPYMHGYFMDMKLYKHIHAVAEPMVFESWRKQKVQSKMEEKLGQRIARKKPVQLPQINRPLAERMVRRKEKENEKASKKTGKPVEEVVAPQTDARFKALFEDSDFEIDQESEQFKQLYPSGFGEASKADRMQEDMDSDEDDSEGATDAPRQRVAAAPNVETEAVTNSPTKELSSGDENEDVEGEDGTVAPAPTLSSKKQTPRKRVRMTAATSATPATFLQLDGEDDEARKSNKSAKSKKKKKIKRRAKTLGEKLADGKEVGSLQALTGGNMEATFDV